MDGAKKVRRLHPAFLMLIAVVVVAGESGHGEELRLMSGWKVATIGMARLKLLHQPQPSCILPSTKTEC